mmetsp:Transcript_24096/g.74265  ORF Transcript_24096/g.74265 Transcript_24096/m.74265 type:complete len:449 (-) Transcript_24096:31-1377(-)
MRSSFAAAFLLVALVEPATTFSTSCPVRRRLVRGAAVASEEEEEERSVEDVVVESLQRLTSEDVDWEGMRAVLREAAYTSHSADWSVTRANARRLGATLPEPESEAFRSMFRRVVVGGGWSDAPPQERPWVVLVGGLNGIRKTTTTYEPWFADALAEALSAAGCREVTKEELPTGGNSFFSTTGFHHGDDRERRIREDVLVARPGRVRRREGARVFAVPNGRRALRPRPPRRRQAPPQKRPLRNLRPRPRHLRLRRGRLRRRLRLPQARRVFCGGPPRARRAQRRRAHAPGNGMRCFSARTSGRRRRQLRRALRLRGAFENPQRIPERLADPSPRRRPRPRLAQGRPPHTLQRRPRRLDRPRRGPRRRPTPRRRRRRPRPRRHLRRLRLWQPANIVLVSSVGRSSVVATDTAALFLGCRRIQRRSLLPCEALLPPCIAVSLCLGHRMT